MDKKKKPLSERKKKNDTHFIMCQGEETLLEFFVVPTTSARIFVVKLAGIRTAV